MVIAVITARGGSKGLPGKNIRHLCDKPLIAHTIDAALEAKIFDRVIVTTDCNDIADISLQYGAEVQMRPSELASDTSGSYEVVEHLLNVLHSEMNEPESFMLLQPTSPLRTANHINEAYQLYKEKQYSSLAGIVENDITPFKCFVENEETGDVEPLFDWESLTKPRQKLPKTFLINGAIYICNIKDFLKQKSFFSQPFGVYKMDHMSSTDIDNIEDFMKAESFLLETIMGIDVVK